MGAELPNDWNSMAASALDWWREAGVDCLVEENPRDWFAKAAPAPTPAQTFAQARIAREAPPTPVAIPLPNTLPEFEAWRLSDAAPDAGWSQSRIGASGDPASGLMVLVDMPDREDIAIGQLLSGAAGRLFDRMLAAIGRDRASIYLAPLAVARPVSGQIDADVAARLADIARHHAGLVVPRRLLLLGNAASRALAGADVPHARGSLRGVNCNGRTVDAVASFHPRFLLESPGRKADAWKDLQMLIRDIES